ncbi:hypothetical protein [Marivirga sp.]|uniref:hypothetical protein n=1 Tax=Marivirga sp. TaxID=2018662 RepID=UPI0025E69C50|nr:hypothetical protein [Marivirga sp.]
METNFLSGHVEISIITKFSNKNQLILSSTATRSVIVNEQKDISFFIIPVEVNGRNFRSDKIYITASIAAIDKHPEFIGRTVIIN